jgi:hypothetical protein
MQEENLQNILKGVKLGLWLGFQRKPWIISGSRVAAAGSKAAKLALLS